MKTIFMISQVSDNSQSCVLPLEMAISCLFMLKVNFFDTLESLRKNAKYMCQLFLDQTLCSDWGEISYKIEI